MPWKLTTKGYVRSKTGTLSLPKAPEAFAKLPGLKITPTTKVAPKPPPKPK